MTKHCWFIGIDQNVSHPFFLFYMCFVALFKCKVCGTVQTTDLSQVYLWSVGEISINLDSGLVYITLRDV